MGLQTKNGTLKFKIFFYFFKKLFYLITLIPFVVFKLNCILYCEFNKIKKWNSESYLATLENFFYNLYLIYIVDYIDMVKSYRIINLKNKITFNPSEQNFFFKNIKKYFIEKAYLENLAEYRCLNTK